MKRSMVLIGLAALMLASSNAMAAVQKGDLELQAAGAYARLDKGSEGGTETDVLLGTGVANYFITNEVALGAMALGAYLKPKDVDAINLYAVGVRGEYNFMTDKPVVPHVFAQAGWGQIDMGGSKVNGTVYGGGAGIRYELRPKAHLLVDAEYNATSGDLKKGCKGLYGVMLGISYMF